MTDQPLQPSRETSAHAIALSRVSLLYGSFVALREVSLQLPAGSSVMLLGPNGAGKSTLLKLLAGLSAPTYGEVRVWDAPPSALRGRIAYMSHSTMLYDELTGPENLAYLLRLQHPAWSPALIGKQTNASLEEVGLDPANPRRLGEYSQGMRQRASLARVLLSEPDLLLLDEPFSNLDLSSAHAMIDRLQTYLAQPDPTRLPRTLLFTTHQAELARPLAGLTLTLEAGRLLPTAAPSHKPESV